MTNDDLAGLLFILTDHDEYSTLQVGVDQWRVILGGFNPGEPWEGEKHFGDCTGEPNTCVTCLVTNLREGAEILNSETDLGEDSLP